MKNIKYILLVSTCCFLPNASKAEINLTFDISNLTTSNSTLHTHHTPMELKPILYSNSGIQLAAVCALGSGGCDSFGFGKSNSDIDLDNTALCEEQGYKSTGNCTNGTSPQNICPYDEDYYKSCACDTSIYTEIGSKDDAVQNCGTLSDITTCSSNDISYYSCICNTTGMTTCSQKESYTSSTEFCKNGDTKYFKTADCITCENPKIVNDNKDGCTCPSNWFECGVLDTSAEGVGSPCVNESGKTLYQSCRCPTTWLSQCNEENNEIGDVSCSINGQTSYESCICPKDWKQCDSGGSNSAKRCTKNGVDYWSDCKSACPNTGTYTSETDCTSGNAYLCTYEDCSTMWYRTGCAVNYIDLCSTTNNCSELGYTQSTADCPIESVKCPYDTSKVFCLKPEGAFGNYYYSKGTIIGVIIPNTNMIMDLDSTGLYNQSSAISSCSSKKVGNKIWVLPTEEEFRQIASELTSVNTSLKAIESTEIDDIYWTCTPDPQNSNMGYYCATYGTCGNMPKSAPYPVRCITYY